MGLTRSLLADACELQAEHGGGAPAGHGGADGGDAFGVSLQMTAIAACHAHEAYRSAAARYPPGSIAAARSALRLAGLLRAAGGGLRPKEPAPAATAAAGAGELPVLVSAELWKATAELDAGKVDAAALVVVDLHQGLT